MYLKSSFLLWEVVKILAKDKDFLKTLIQYYNNCLEEVLNKPQTNSISGY